MAINPITWKEENPITTGSSTWNIVPQSINAWGVIINRTAGTSDADWNQSLASSWYQAPNPVKVPTGTPQLATNTVPTQAPMNANVAGTTIPTSTRPATTMTSTITPNWAKMNAQLTPIGEWMPWAVWNPLKWWELPDKKTTSTTTPANTPAPTSTTTTGTAPKSISIGGMAYSKPDYMTDEQWTEATNQMQNSVTNANAIYADALEKARKKGVEDTKTAYSSYNIAKAQYDQNKQYFTNYDEKNNLFNNVLNNLQLLQSQNPSAQLSDAQFQQIANQYWIPVEQVKNPLNIFSDPVSWLKMTAEWERILGNGFVYKQKNAMADFQTDFERKKADLATNLQQTQQNFQWQIDDVAKQAKRNEDWMVASGVWSGAWRSSGYQQWIKNVHDDAQTTIQRLTTLAQQASAANAEDVKRLTDDFNTWVSRAKTELDDQLKSITQDVGVKMNWLTEQYWVGNKALTTQLDSIITDMNNNINNAQGNYINNIKAINTMMQDNMTFAQKAYEYQQTLANKTYDSLLENNGVQLGNTSMTTLTQMMKDGKLNPDQVEKLKSVQLAGIQNSISKLGTLSTADLHTIEELLDQWQTPAEIIATLGWQDKFKTGEQKFADQYTEVMPWVFQEKATWQYFTKDQLVNKLAPWQSGSYSPTIVWGDGTSSTITGTVWGTDFTSLAWKYPNVAAFKNNNPAWITWNANFSHMTPWSLADRLKQAWINFSMWTARPAKEWGNYVKFNSIEDGLKAVKLMWQISSENGQTVWQRLKSWSVAWYSLPWVDLTKKFNQLSEDQQDEVIMKQMQHESPWLSKELSNAGIFWPEWINWWETATQQTQSYNPNLASDYKQYTDKGTVPAGLKYGTKEYNQFVAEASSWKKDQPVASADWALTPEEESLVEALKNYTLDPNKLPWGMSKEWQAAKKRILAAAFWDANYDMKKYQAKQKFYNNWTSWAMNTNNNGIQTVTGHIMELKPALEALDNGNFQKFNELWNNANTQVWAPETNDAKLIATAVASEMAKVYKWGNAAATEAEIEDFKNMIQTKLSAGQQKGMIKTLASLMMSKIKANADSYKRTMESMPENIFDPEQTKFLKSQWVNVYDAFTSKKGEYTYADWSKIEFDWNGKYRYTPVGWKAWAWTKEWTEDQTAVKNAQKSSVAETIGIMTAWQNSPTNVWPTPTNSYNWVDQNIINLMQ